MYPNNNCSDCPQCSSTIVPLPLPDLSGLCGDQYNAACVIYTGEDITCLGIESGMTFLEVLDIFNNVLPVCDCCNKVKQDCVTTDWGPWSECECYYENEELICGRQSRTKTIITPPANGGTLCGPLIEYQDCIIEDVCFTFGSDICETAPNPTQILPSPFGIFSNKPYYRLYFDCSGTTLYVWYNTLTGLWNITPNLGETDSLYQTLDNNGNYLPISNQIDQRWSFTEGGGYYNNLIASQETTCPDVNICFKFYFYNEVFGELTFYSNIAPTHLGDGSFPVYNWSYVIPNPSGSNVLTMTVTYGTAEQKWIYIAQYNSGDPLAWSTLDISSFYPFSTTTVEWQPLENMAVYSSQMLSSTQDACVQPPDVDCVWTCSGWSACTAGCTQTQTCTITTPASGNGICLPSPPTQQSCCEPSCGQPISPIAVIVGANVEITFTAISGAFSYILTYNYTGGSPTSIESSLPSFSFPWVCGVTYTGSIITVCATLDSLPTPFTIEIPACPEPEACNGNITNIIAGTFATPQQKLLKINSSTGAIQSAFPVLNGIISNFPLNNPTFWTSELCNDGLFIAGNIVNLSDENGFFPGGGVVKLNCSLSTSTSYSTINRTFLTSTLAGIGFSVNLSNQALGITPVIRAIKYDSASNRLYVGGRFDTYKGLNCSKNLVCLNATTGAIIPISTFKIGIGGLAGIFSNTTPTQGVYDIQIDGNGKIVVAGMFDTYSNNLNIITPARNILRLNFDGTLDTFAISGTSFSTYQSTRFDSSNKYSLVKTIYIDSINDIYAGGAFYTYNGITANHIVKIKNSGSIAPTLEFNSGSGFLLDGINSGWLKVITSLEAAPYVAGDCGVSIEKIVPHVNGLLITGNFGMYNGSRVNALVKINTNGTIDTSFTVDITSIWSLPINGTVYRSGMDIKVLNNNKVLFGGVLNNYLSTGTNSYYVLNANGTVDIGATNIGVSTDPIMVKTIADYFM